MNALCVKEILYGWPMAVRRLYGAIFPGKAGPLVLFHVNGFASLACHKIQAFTGCNSRKMVQGDLHAVKCYLVIMQLDIDPLWQMLITRLNGEFAPNGPAIGGVNNRRLLYVILFAGAGVELVCFQLQERLKSGLFGVKKLERGGM